jgi:hypothetical protein
MVGGVLHRDWCHPLPPPLLPPSTRPTGGELFEHISREGGLTEARAANVLRSLMLFLAHCHARSLAHMDIKVGGEWRDWGRGGAAEEEGGAALTYQWHM